MTFDFDLKIKYQFVSESDYNSIRDPAWPDYQTFVLHQSNPQVVYDDIDRMLSDKKAFDHPSFCVLPWYGREITWNKNETHCCHLPKNYNIESIRSAMKANQRPPECQKCWKLEDQNLVSDRKIKNSSLDTYTNTDIHQIMEQANTEEIKMLKLFASYTCNGACAYCSSDSSSFWNVIEKRTNKTIPIKNYKLIDLDHVKEKVDFSKLSTLSLLGGEPLLEKNNFSFLKELISVGNTNLFISIVTNGSVVLTQEQTEIFRQFPNLNFCLSIDGKGSVFEYTRWPLEWDVVEKNIDRYRLITDNLSVSYTISNLNILYHQRITKWFKENNLNWINSPVYDPNYFSPRVLPVSAKHKLKDHLDENEFNFFIGDPDRDPGHLWNRFIQEIKSQDRAKGIEIQKYLPEFCQLVGIN